MSKPISLFDKQYESLVEHLVEKDGAFVLRTVDQRFFRLNGSSGKLLQDIEAGHALEAEPEQVRHFVEHVLLGKGIYQQPGQPSRHVAKKPGLAWHVPVLPGVTVTRLVGRMRWLLNPLIAFALLGLCVVLQGHYFMSHTHHFSYDFLFSFTQGEIGLLLIASLATSFFHELGHATACRRFAGKTGEIGFGINVVVPVFFANVSNLHLVGRRQRLVIGLSGLYFQTVFSTIVLVTCYGWLPVEKYLAINLISMLINSVPLFRNDGYWVLNDALGRRDLLSDTAKRFLGRGRVGWVEVFYGALFFVFTGLMVWLVSRFVWVRGPELIHQLLQAPNLTFTVAVRFLLVGCQYLAIGLGVFLLIRQVVVQCIKFHRARLKKA